MTVDLSGVLSAMEPEALQEALAAFPVVTFVPVPWMDLEVCQGCLSCDPLGGCDSTAVLVTRRFLGENALGEPVYSHTNRMPTASCCMTWEIKTALRHGNDVTVEVLMMREAA
jgi:hypothetical protein